VSNYVICLVLVADDIWSCRTRRRSARVQLSTSETLTALRRRTRLTAGVRRGGLGF